MITVDNYKSPDGSRRIKVTRPSIFSNPFSHKPCGWACASNNSHVIHVNSREEAISKFAEYWYAPEQKGLRLLALDFPADAVLICVCHPKSCHADIIAGYVNWKRNDF